MGEIFWEGGGAEPLSLSYWPGAQWAKDSSGSTHMTKLFPTRQDDRNGPSLSEPWFSQEGDQPSQGRHSDSSHRPPRNREGGKSGVNSISGAWDQQAEKGAGGSELSPMARQTQRSPCGSLSQRHHVPSRHLTSSFFLSTKG